MRSNREGALLHYSSRRGLYYSVGRTNRGGRSHRGSTVYLVCYWIKYETFPLIFWSTKDLRTLTFFACLDMTKFRQTIVEIVAEAQYSEL